MIELLKLQTVPVAVQFSTDPPPGVPQFNSSSKNCSMLDLARPMAAYSIRGRKITPAKMAAISLVPKPFNGLETGDLECIEMLDNVVDALERVLDDRPDLKRLVEGGVSVVHEATPQEIAEQIATGSTAKIE